MAAVAASRRVDAQCADARVAPLRSTDACDAQCAAAITSAERGTCCKSSPSSGHTQC